MALTRLIEALDTAIARLNDGPTWDAELRALCAELGLALGFSRVALFEVHGREGAAGGSYRAGHGLRATCRVDWAAEGLASLVNDTHPPLRPIDADPILQAWAERRTRGEVVSGLTRDLTGYARRYFEQAGIVSFYTVPVMVNGRWWGHFCASFDDPDRPWGGMEKAALHAVTGLIARAVERSVSSGAISEAGRRVMLESALDGVVTIDEAGLVLEFNPAAELMFGYDRADVVGRPLGATIIPPAQAHSHKVGLERYLRTGSPTILGRRVETQGRRSDGTVFPIELTVTEVGTSGRRLFTAYLRDISERLRAREALERLAFEDGATGLPNRAGLLRRVEAAGAAAGAVVLQWPDLDMLAASIGRAILQPLLAELALRLRRLLPEDAILARTGEREFAAILFRGTDAASLSGDLSRLASRPLEIEGRRFYLRPAIGVAPPGGTAEAMLRDAEMASRAVSAGQVRVFDDSLRADHQARLDLETALREAVARRSGEIFPAFQPIVETGSGRTVGFEALARWRPRPDREVMPGVFIPLAEAVGLVDGLGQCILEQAVAECAAWSRERAAAGLPPRHVAVNLAASQLSAPDLVSRVADVLAGHALPGAMLHFELTESAILSQPESAVRVLEELRRMGCTIAIDDFGTGYSSFSYLERLPVDVLKIDRSFMRAVAESERARKIVAVMVDLAHGLGLSVVAEGVETPDILDQVVALGCDFAQGFLLGRPMPGAEARRLGEARKGACPEA